LPYTVKCFTILYTVYPVYTLRQKGDRHMQEQTAVKAWGNSLAIRLNKYVLEIAKIQLNDVLQVEASENMIVLKKVQKHRSLRNA